MVASFMSLELREQVRLGRNEPPVFDRRLDGLAHATMLDRGRLCY